MENSSGNNESWFQKLARNYWFPRPKVIAALVVGGGIYLLEALGVDVSSITQETGELLGINIPNEEAVTVWLASLIAAYIKSD